MLRSCRSRPRPHALPQAPQFAVSLCVFVQVDPHVVSGVGQLPTIGSSPVHAMIAAAAPVKASAAQPNHFALRIIVDSFVK